MIYSAGQVFWVVITLGLALIPYWLRSKQTRYEISSQRIKMERGILSKKRDNLELFRVDDFEILQPLGMRLLGSSVLRLETTDRTNRSVFLYGLKNVPEIAEELRDCIAAQRAAQGVRIFGQ